MKKYLEMLKLDSIKKYFNKKNKKRANLINFKEAKVSSKKRKTIKINFKFLNFLKKVNRRFIPFLAIFSISFLLIIFFLIVWPFFRVKYIEITKKDNITNMNIAYKSLDSLRWEKLFNIKESDILQRLRNYQDNIKSISLKTNLPNTLKIEIESYKSVFNTNVWENTYILLENWTLIPSSHDKDLNQLIINTELDKNQFFDYKKIFNDIYVSRITRIIKLLQDNFVNIKFNEFYYHEKEREIHIGIESSGLLIFSIEQDYEVEEQVEKLAILNKDYFGIGQNIYNYIDLRAKNKVFYCTRERDNQCNSNLKNLYWY